MWDVLGFVIHTSLSERMALLSTQPPIQ